MRKYEPDPSLVLEWSELDLEANVSFEEKPLEILNKRDQVLWGKMISLMKVLWSHRCVEEATWEREAEMRSKYPDLF